MAAPWRVMIFYTRADRFVLVLVLDSPRGGGYRGREGRWGRHALGSDEHGTFSLSVFILFQGWTNSPELLVGSVYLPSL